eukprot:symbB.v1.2.032608.t1/scaffold3932.1/size48061/1
MHARASEKPEGYALSLRCVGQGTGRTLDTTAPPYPEPMDHQLLMAMQAARFLDCQTYFEDYCIPLILRGLMKDAAFRCLLLRMPQMGSQRLPSLQALLMNEDFVKCGVGIGQDLRLLSAQFGLESRGAVDLQHLAQKYGYTEYGLGLASLCKAVLQRRLDKRMELRCSNWTGELSDEQINYAACDAFVAVEMLEELELRHGELGLKEWCREFMDKYGGCRLLSPGGLHLANVSGTKAAWYVQMGLGTRLDDDRPGEQVVVQLNFEPKGVGHAGDEFYLQIMENQCVGCGAKDHLVRFSIVPHVFRALLPKRFKEHSSHDIVLLCHSCYIPASASSQALRHRYLSSCGLSTPSSPGAAGRYRMGTLDAASGIDWLDQRKLKARGAAVALQHPRLPSEVRTDKEAVLRNFLGKAPGEPLTSDDLEIAKKLDPKVPVDGYISPEANCTAQLRLVEAEDDGLEERCFDFVLSWRQTFLDSVKPQHLPAAQSCRRRFGRWQEQPVAEVLTLDSDLSFLEEASLSVTLREALSKNLSIRAAFDIFDADKNGSLDMVETWAALYHLGLRGISADQVVRFFDIMDEAKVGRVGFTEFHNFVEAAVQEKSHHIRLEETRPSQETSTLSLPSAPIALRRIISSESPTTTHGIPPLFRQTSPTVPEEGALHLPLQPPDLARLTSAVPGPASPMLARGGTVPPQLGRHSSFQATSTLFSEPRFKEELELAKSTFAERQREKEAAHEQLYSQELKVIEEKHDEEEERIMGTNPSLSEAGDAAEWSFQRARLPKGTHTVPQHRCDFEIDPDSLIPDRKRCILQAGASLELSLPRGLATSNAHRPALEAYTLTVFFQLPKDWAPTSGQMTPLFDFPRAEEAMWGETSAQLVILHDGSIALRSTGDDEFKKTAKKDEEEIAKKKQAQKDLEKKRKDAIKAAKKAKLKKEPSETKETKKEDWIQEKEEKQEEETKEETEEKKEEKKEDGDFRLSPSVGTWFTGLHGDEKDTKGDEESKKNEDEKEKDDKEPSPYESWWPPHGCKVAKEANANAPSGPMACEAKVVKAGQWNLLTMVVQCASACLPEERFVTAYLNGEAAFHLTSHPALEEALAMDLHGGIRLLPPSSSSIAMPGGQLRTLEVRCRALPLEEVLEAQVPRGVWKCNKCKRYNPPAKRLEKPLCYCGVVRPNSAARPKDDKDDDHPGLTVVVADSFQELVIDSDRHVFLDVYADWCGPCVQAKPHFHKLASLLRACDDIGICSERAQIQPGWILGDFVSIRHAGTSSKRQAAVVQEMAVMQRKKSWLFLLTLLLIVFGLGISFGSRKEAAQVEPASKNHGVKLLGLSSFQLFPVTNISLVSWFFLIFFPRWKQLKSAVIVGPVVNASFYAAVAFLAARNPDAPAVNFKSLEGIKAMFGDSDACFAGWLHYCVFDPLVGLGEVLDSRQLKVPHLLVVPCLVMTMLAGPVGFLMYMCLRSIVRWTNEDAYMVQ